jgi:hypothetical protein
MSNFSLMAHNFNVVEAGPAPAVCKVFECDAYEQGLIDSTSMYVALLTDGADYAIGAPLNAIKDTGWFKLKFVTSIATGFPDREPRSQKLLPDGCPPSFALQYDVATAMTSQITEPTSNAQMDWHFTWSQLIQRIGTTGEYKAPFDYETRSFNGLEFDFFPDPFSIRLIFEQWNETDPPTEYITGFRSNTEKVNVSFSYNNTTRTWILYKNWVEFKRGTLATPYPDDNFLAGQANADFAGHGRFSHLAYWNHAVTPEEVAELRDAWLRNEVGYTDPDPECIPP